MRTRSYLFVVVATVVALTVIGGTSAHGSQRDTAKTVAITIDNFSFGMTPLEVPVGTTVTWTNRDDIPHTVASTTKVFKSGPLDTGDSFSYTFSAAGTFEYYCSVHPRMTSTIVVK